MLSANQFWFWFMANRVKYNHLYIKKKLPTINTSQCKEVTIIIVAVLLIRSL